MQKQLIGGILVLAAFFLSPARASAQSAAAFMLVPLIQGESTDEQHRNWIDVLSVAQSFEAATRNSGCGAQVTKAFDKAGPPLWLAAVTGQRFNEIRIEFVRQGLDQQRYYELLISNARISAIHSTPLSLSESLEIAGDGATLNYYSQNASGQTVLTATASLTCK